MADRKPCPNHPSKGDVDWFDVFVPADTQYPGQKHIDGELPICADCVKEMK